jgi:hypothetical protein
MLKKYFIRDGSRKIIGSVTTGYSDTSSVVRDERNRITGSHQRTVPHDPRK